MDIPVGTAGSESALVDERNVASAVGSGAVDVFATPMMIALIEKAASRCIEPRLDAGMASVGTRVNMEHSAATPVGMKVTATATVAAVERRRIDFDVVAFDEAGEIGRGTHTRVVVDKAKFVERARARKPS